MADLIKVLGFAPDLDPSTEGVLTDCSNLLPTIRGMVPAPSAVTAGLTALPNPTLGAAIIERLDSTKRAFVGMQTALYEDVAGTWIDRTRVSGPYTTGTDGVWRFAAFGNASLATNGADKLQQSIDGVFSDMPVPVKAIQLTNAGSGFTSVPTVTIAAPDTTGVNATAEAVLTPTGVGSITVMNAGSGYSSAPTVVIGAPDHLGGVQATATATLSGMTIASVTITNAGSGYSQPPTVSFTGGSGVNGAATALLSGTTIQAINLDNKGSGYSTAPSVVISGGGGTGATATTTIADVPVGKIVTTCAGQVFVLNLTQGGDATADGWFCSGIYDQTDWSADISTQSAFARIVDFPGGITAAKPLANNLIVYKNSSMFIGTRQGPPIGWAFENVSNQIGAACQESVISIGTAHYFIGPDNFYFYQAGAYPTPIGDHVKEWYFANVNPTLTTKMSSYYDEQRSLLFWAFVSTESLDGSIDKCLVYNWKTGIWGRQDLKMEGFVEVINGQITFDSLGTQWNDWDDLPQISYDSTYWTYTRLSQGYFDTTHTLQQLVGYAANSSMTTGDIGEDDVYSRMQYIRVRFNGRPPSSGTGIWYGRAHIGDVAPDIWTSSTGAMHDNKFDIDQSARWHRLQMDLIGTYEVLGFIPKLIPEGEY